MGKEILSLSNLKKTYFYFKKNGLKNVYYAALERIRQNREAEYVYETPGTKELERQREAAGEADTFFSILVPAYETNPEYLKQMVDSVLEQTYGRLELMIADASATDTVERVIRTYSDGRIRYIKLEKNGGISENTNAALSAAAGDYIGLLDHDDVLTPDALYEMAKAIQNLKINGEEAKMLYSDEDKGDGNLSRFYEPHHKLSFNLDLLLSNNYICHFLVMKKELMKELLFRPEFDGAQDYDLVLRAAQKLKREAIVHLPKVLYHWRCHSDSTAQNPASKAYAYEAGRRAVEDFLGQKGWNGEVRGMKHLGFYQVSYRPDILTVRQEVGVIGGKVLDYHGRIAGGIYNEQGEKLYAGLRKEYSGYMHRASLQQEAYAVDWRRMRVRKELYGLFEEVYGLPYEEDEGTRCFAHADGENQEKDMEFARRVRALGYQVVWLPDMK